MVLVPAWSAFGPIPYVQDSGACGAQAQTAVPYWPASAPAAQYTRASPPPTASPTTAAVAVAAAALAASEAQRAEAARTLAFTIEEADAALRQARGVVRPSRIPFAPCSLRRALFNAIGDARATLSRRFGHLRAACALWLEEQRAWNCLQDDDLVPQEATDWRSPPPPPPHEPSPRGAARLPRAFGGEDTLEPELSCESPRWQQPQQPSAAAAPPAPAAAEARGVPLSAARAAEAGGRSRAEPEGSYRCAACAPRVCASLACLISCGVLVVGPPQSTHDGRWYFKRMTPTPLSGDSGTVKRSHCQAGIGLQRPIPYDQNLLFSVARGVPTVSISGPS